MKIALFQYSFRNAPPMVRTEDEEAFTSAVRISEYVEVVFSLRDGETIRRLMLEETEHSLQNVIARDSEQQRRQVKELKDRIDELARPTRAPPLEHRPNPEDAETRCPHGVAADEWCADCPPASYSPTDSCDSPAPCEDGFRAAETTLESDNDIPF